MVITGWMVFGAYVAMIFLHPLLAWGVSVFDTIVERIYQRREITQDDIDRSSPFYNKNDEGFIWVFLGLLWPISLLVGLVFLCVPMLWRIVLIFLRILFNAMPGLNFPNVLVWLNKMIVGKANR